MDFTVSAEKNKENRLHSILLLGGVCFFIGRACFTEGLAPAGAALLLTLAMNNLILFGNWQKALITASIVITAQSIFCVLSESVCSINEILLNGGVAMVFSILFDVLIRLWKKETLTISRDVALLAASATATLMIIGTNLIWLFLPFAAVLAVFSGYIWGVAEGVLVSFASGMLLLICGQAPMQILWLLLSGAAAGFLKEESRLASGALVILIGLLTNCLELIPAGVLLILVPEVILTAGDLKLRRLLPVIPEEADKNLRELSLIFASLDNPRSRMGYEFKAMLQLCQGSKKTAKKRRRKIQKAAVSGYAGSGQRSGDSCLWENLNDGTFAIVLSDGMGKGKAAAQESNLATTSVIKLLKAGLEAELVLKLLNSIIMMDANTEHFPTMDLGILDPEKGEFYLYKIGAAPTLIKRGEQVEVLEAAAMPMGVMEQEGINCLSTIVHPGDQIIMMSDGIVDSERDDLELKWLKNFLLQIHSKNPQTISDLVIKEAAENYREREKDDMTVACLIVR